MARKSDASPIMFILGGASVPLGMPTTVSLRKALCDDTPEGRAAAEIHRSAAYRFRLSEDSVNIEDFLEHLYELQLMMWLAQRSRLPQLLPGFTAIDLRGAALRIPQIRRAVVPVVALHLAGREIR
jgi:hypothetical protein